MRLAGRRFRAHARGCALYALAPALVLLVAPAVAAATPPVVTIEAPTPGEVVHDTSPEIAGTTGKGFEPELLSQVKVDIYAGNTAAGAPVRELFAVQEPTVEAWSVNVAPPLEPGEYTVRAEQTEFGGEPGKSNAVSFIVAAPPPPAPHVTITYPANYSSAMGESQLLTGAAGVAPGDRHEVTVELFAGPTPTPPARAILHVPSSGATWSAVFGGLAPGTYTAQATQENEAGSVGTSAADTFTLSAPPPPPPAAPPPSASFSWFPAAPVVGQTVVLVSSATDPASPITSFGWDLAGGGPFQAAGPVLATSFASAGNHAVRLRVTDARGLSSVAGETIPVAPLPLRPMQPFPIVRFAGVETSSGVRLSLLSVQAPVGARVTVTCRGRGCATKPQSRIASAGKRDRHASWALLSFGAFERQFRAGVTLEVRVAAAGELGKYTLFAIHRHALPTRVDSCLAALDPRPIACST